MGRTDRCKTVFFVCWFLFWLWGEGLEKGER